MTAARQRRFTVADGLPTNEIQQIVQLPNRQMLVNCVGVFCLYNGRTFDVLPCERDKAMPLPHFLNRYGTMWQGDSLLWLRDLYRLYLFDARTCLFRSDVAGKYDAGVLGAFVTGRVGDVQLSASEQALVDSLQMRANCNDVVTDWQGGTWIATRSSGITYIYPERAVARVVRDDDALIDRARSIVDGKGCLWRCKSDGLECECAEGMEAVVTYDRRNVRGLLHERVSFVAEVDDERYLLCNSLSLLGYFAPKDKTFRPVGEHEMIGRKYRHIVGACMLDGKWMFVYTQNGAFMLDVKADTVSGFEASNVIERYSDKYNCVLKAVDGTLWIGTQNGLFKVVVSQRTKDGKMSFDCERVGLLANNCIQSLLCDGEGNVWAGTACGVSRVTPFVVNLGYADGVPAASMMERASFVKDDGTLVFVLNSSSAVVLRPEWVACGSASPGAVCTGVEVNGRQVSLTDIASFSYKERDFVFRFSTLDYANVYHSLYRYRMMGLDDEWHCVTDHEGQVEVAYASLQPGEYAFEIQTTNGKGEWGNTVSVPFVINPPLWKTWWAKSLYSLIFIGLVVASLHYYLKKKRERIERENDERVNRLFELRDEARHHFAESTSVNPANIGINTEEEQFVTRMLRAIEANIDDEAYNVDMLARDVAVSRASLYKKVQVMLGITPTEFIRNVRLKHGAQLLEDTDKPIADIAAGVGFATARNFSSYFKKMFGVTPSEYRDKAAGDNMQ